MADKSRVVRNFMHLDLVRDSARTFPVLENPEQFTSARVWHCKYRSLKELAKLTNIEELVIASFPDGSFEALSGIRRLRYLKVVHLPKVADVEALGTLDLLRSLSLATLPTWDSAGKTSVLESLAPIARLPAIEHVELFGVRQADASLTPLESCRTLKSARFAGYPLEEIERFYRSTGVANEFNPPADFERG